MSTLAATSTDEIDIRAQAERLTALFTDLNWELFDLLDEETSADDLVAVLVRIPELHASAGTKMIFPIEYIAGIFFERVAKKLRGNDTEGDLRRLLSILPDAQNSQVILAVINAISDLLHDDRHKFGNFVHLVPALKEALRNSSILMKIRLELAAKIAYAIKRNHNMPYVGTFTKDTRIAKSLRMEMMKV